MNFNINCLFKIELDTSTLIFVCVDKINLPYMSNSESDL